MGKFEADYIVIGGGSAGCVVANRLSADSANKVILLEAGGTDWNPWIHIPVGYFQTMHNPKYDWCYKTEKDEGIAGRSLDWPRGKVLGGSSSLNGLLYVRGQKEDYDRWQQMGNKGWDWQNVLPYFKRSEDQERGADEFHSIGGGLSVSNARLSRPICDAWVEAAQVEGYAFNQDYNGATQEGVGYFQLTTKGGKRCSSAVAFLNPAKSRENLNTIVNAQVTKIEISNGRATAVHYKVAGGSVQRIKVNKEVVLSAGAIGSPHILMLSGIGDKAHLEEHGIEVKVDLPGVGKNLQDHLQARIVYKTKEATLNDEVRTLWNKMKIGIRYALTRTGPMTMAASLACGFVKTELSDGTPDIQYHIQPWSADSPGEGVHPFSAFTVSICQLRPESTGEILLKSADPDEYPAIHPNYLKSEYDQRVLLEGIKIANKIAEHEPLKGKIAERHSPTPEKTTDEDLLAWAREKSTTIYHPTGTCKMGSDPMAVVDDRLRVHGISGLRVADCSIMPQIVSGNTNAPAIMIGEKLSDMVLEDNKV